MRFEQFFLFYFNVIRGWMSQSTSNLEYQNFQRIYSELLKMPKIRFVSFVDYMGNLIIGGFRKGVNPLKEESERQKNRNIRYS